MIMSFFSQTRLHQWLALMRPRRMRLGYVLNILERNRGAVASMRPRRMRLGYGYQNLGEFMAELASMRPRRMRLGYS